MPTILIVDDENVLLEFLHKQLYNFGYNTLTAARGEEAMDIYEKNAVDLILLDVKLPDINGMQILQKIRSNDPWLPIVVMTAYSGVKGAVEAIKLGASDYIEKPLNIEELKYVISRCIESQKAVAEVNHIRSNKKEKYSFDKIITRNAEMRRIIGLSERLANNIKSTVLILGESGTGKELFANAIHYNDKGGRSKGPFIAVNCSALSAGVLESELFGHEKGAFTGAIGKKRGLFEIADKGTIFLDEIGEISPQTQVKLLRFIENHTFQRVGGTKDIEVDVRIMAATNKDLFREVHNGKFREDLYYRLNVISLVIPPLRNRKEDIPFLINYFIDIYGKILNKNITGCNDEAMKIMINYTWPGNVRELRNIIERAVLLSEDEIIKPSDLPLEMDHHSDEIDKIKMPDLMALDKLINLYTKKALDECGSMTNAAKALSITRQRVKRILSKSNR
ncbi:MAG TPA: sigma-54 dependent transcriptional regulator [Syntrophales bacterium]|nr:sigma-54 dependent transcriptional regulator [Syntrophales bacterium]HQM29789.1 sigma-54 dependent transcriptional regulator [Syntrophales bacterium]